MLMAPLYHVLCDGDFDDTLYPVCGESLARFAIHSSGHYNAAVCLNACMNNLHAQIPAGIAPDRGRHRSIQMAQWKLETQRVGAKPLLKTGYVVISGSF